MNGSALRLRNDLLRDGNDIPWPDSKTGCANSSEQAFRELRTGTYFRHVLDGRELQLHFNDSVLSALFGDTAMFRCPCAGRQGTPAGLPAYRYRKQCQAGP